MGLDTYPLEQSIQAKLESIFPLKVYDDDIPEDESLEYDSHGTLVPFMIVEWGDLTRPLKDRTLVSVRNDSYNFFFTVSVVTGRSEDTSVFFGKLMDGLTGFRPTDSGEVIPKGSMRFSRSAVINRPTQYIRSATFQCITNLTT